MIDPSSPCLPGPVAISSANALRAEAAVAGTPSALSQQGHQRLAEAEAKAEAKGATTDPADTVLCRHCGRTAANGIPCQGMCVADSGY